MVLKLIYTNLEKMLIFKLNFFEFCHMVFFLGVGGGKGKVKDY